MANKTIEDSKAAILVFFIKIDKSLFLKVT